MSSVSDWVKDIIVVILALTFIQIVLPDSSISKYVRFIFSMIILATILAPVSYFCNKLIN